MEHFPRELMVAHGGCPARGSTRLSKRFTAGSCSKSKDVPLAGGGDAGDTGHSVLWWDQSMELVLGSRCPGELRAGGWQGRQPAIAARCGLPRGGQLVWGRVGAGG